MASKTDICNYALAEIGERTVTNIEDSSEGQHAVWANKLYRQTKLEVLSMHKWGCARKRVELSESATAPVFGYTNAFELPDDFIRQVSINETDPDIITRDKFERVGTQLFTDEEQVWLDYIFEVDDDNMEPLLVQAIYTLLSSKLAWAIQQNRTQQEMLYEKFQRVLREARYTDSVGQHKPRPNMRTDSDWMAARYSSTNG